MANTTGISAQFNNGAVSTMSSREIADIAEARHNDVVATIDRLFDKGFCDQVVKAATRIQVAAQLRFTTWWSVTFTLLLLDTAMRFAPASSTAGRSWRPEQPFHALHMAHCAKNWKQWMCFLAS